MHTVLLADDSVTVQRVIALTFAGQGFRVVTVADGREAIARVQTERPDIVLAGTKLAGATGYEVARFVRGHESLKRVPVVLLKGAFEAPDPEALAGSGAAGVLEKPLDPTTVLNRVKELLGLTGGAGKRDAPGAGRPARPVTTGLARPKPIPGPPRAANGPPASASPAPAKTPARPPEPHSWEELRRQSGLEADVRPVEGQPRGTGGDYLDTLDAAFDSLDAKLAGRAAEPAPTTATQSTFPAPSGPAVPPRVAAVEPPGPPVFEVDETWFAPAERAAADQVAERQRLAAEMGIHEVELPEPEPVTHPAVRPSATAPEQPGAAPVAEAFNALLAIEQAQAHGVAPPGAPVPPVVLQTPTPEITEEMLDRLAADVAERLSDRVPAPAITAEMLSQISGDIAGRLAVPPVPAPQVTSEMLDRLAGQVAERLRVPAPVISSDMLVQLAQQVAERLTVQAPAPQVTGEMLDRLAGQVAERLRVPAPVISSDMLVQLAQQVAERLTVQAPAPQITAEVAGRIADEVAKRLPVTGGIPDETVERIAARVASRVPAPASVAMPAISEEMVERLAAQVAARVQVLAPASPFASAITSEVVASLAAEVASRVPAPTAAAPISDELLERMAVEVARRLPVAAPAGPPEIAGEMLDRLAGSVVERLAAGPLGAELAMKLASGVQDAVRQVVSEASERLVRDEIARIRSEAAAEPDA